jgi:hypothetical protein
VIAQGRRVCDDAGMIRTKPDARTLAARALLGCLVFAASVVGAGEARAGKPIRYSRERGGDCSVMIPYYGPASLWLGRVSGGRNMDVSSDRVFTDWRVPESCFFEQIDCERWIANIGSQYSLPPGFAYCIPLAQALRSGARTIVKP